jgi:hypothetical protein
MALLSFFGSAQAILKILQCKTFSIATTEMSRLPTTGIGRFAFVTNRESGLRLPIITNRSAGIPDASYSAELPVFGRPKDTI